MKPHQRPHIFPHVLITACMCNTLLLFPLFSSFVFFLVKYNLKIIRHPRFIFLIYARTKQVDCIDDPKIRLEEKLLLFPLFRLNTVLVKNLETLVSISPSPMLIWVSQWSECFKIRVAQHWGGRRHISGGKTV